MGLDYHLTIKSHYGDRELRIREETKLYNGSYHSKNENPYLEAFQVFDIFSNESQLIFNGRYFPFHPYLKDFKHGHIAFKSLLNDPKFSVARTKPSLRKQSLIKLIASTRKANY